MKITDQHISESVLDELIVWAGTSNDALVKALLELKQRRAEQRQQETYGFSVHSSTVIYDR